MTFSLPSWSWLHKLPIKQQRRRRRRHKFVYFTVKNNSLHRRFSNSHHSKWYGSKAKTIPTTVRTSYENVTSCFCNNYSIIPSLYACKMCSKYHGIKSNQRLTDKKTKLKICRQVLKSSTQWQKNSFYVVERRRTVLKGTKMKSVKKLHPFSSFS